MRSIRKSKKLKQVDIARLMGVPESNVSFWERQSVLRSDVIEKFCSALQIDLYLFYAPPDLQPIDLTPQEAYVIQMYRALPLDLQGKFVEINERISKLLADVVERAVNRK